MESLESLGLHVYMYIYHVNAMYVSMYFHYLCPCNHVCDNYQWSLPTFRTADNETLLLLAIRHQLHPVVDKLCDMGADLSICDCKGNSPLWVALRSRQEACAAKLVNKIYKPGIVQLYTMLYVYTWS